MKQSNIHSLYKEINMHHKELEMIEGIIKAPIYVGIFAADSEANQQYYE